MLQIRKATDRDLGSINDIYNHYVGTCTCTWQLVPDTLAERRAWFEVHRDDYAALVAEEEGRVVAWASDEYSGPSAVSGVGSSDCWAAETFQARQKKISPMGRRSPTGKTVMCMPASPNRWYTSVPSS